MKNVIRDKVQFIFRFTNKMSNDHVRAYAAEASFFAIMSFLPILMLILSLIRFTPLGKEQIVVTLEGVTPFEITGILTPIVNGMYRQAAKVMPAVIIAALWAAGKSIIGLMDGLNSVYRIPEERNYILLRVRAMFYAFVLAIALLLSLLVLVFGYDILELLKSEFPVLNNYEEALTILPMLSTMILLTILFSLMYTFLPNRHRKLLKQVPGAVFTSVAWSVFSYAFSIYLELARTMTLLYGSLTTLIGIMMWLYFCMFLLFIGAEINHYLVHPELFALQEHTP